MEGSYLLGRAIRSHHGQLDRPAIPKCRRWRAASGDELQTHNAPDADAQLCRDARRAASPARTSLLDATTTPCGRVARAMSVTDEDLDSMPPVGRRFLSGLIGPPPIASIGTQGSSTNYSQRDSPPCRHSGGCQAHPISESGSALPCRGLCQLLHAQRGQPVGWQYRHVASIGTQTCWLDVPWETASLLSAATPAVP